MTPVCSPVMCWWQPFTGPISGAHSLGQLWLSLSVSICSTLQSPRYNQLGQWPQHRWAKLELMYCRISPRPKQSSKWGLFANALNCKCPYLHMSLKLFPFTTALCNYNIAISSYFIHRWCFNTLYKWMQIHVLAYSICYLWLISNHCGLHHCTDQCLAHNNGLIIETKIFLCNMHPLISLGNLYIRFCCCCIVLLCIHCSTGLNSLP